LRDRRIRPLSSVYADYPARVQGIRAGCRFRLTVSDYTVKNLRQVEDSAPRFGFAPDMEARFAARELGLGESGVSLQRLAPGAGQPFGHRHKRQEELYVVVDGSGRVQLDDEVVELGPWDAVRVAPEVSRSFAAGPDGLEFLAFGAPAVESLPEDVEQEPSPWEGEAD
jgi:mannose-6-phosphate isomerase-like protein (cupin superfamily)